VVKVGTRPNRAHGRGQQAHGIVRKVSLCAIARVDVSELQRCTVAPLHSCTVAAQLHSCTVAPSQRAQGPKSTRRGNVAHRLTKGLTARFTGCKPWRPGNMRAPCGVTCGSLALEASSLAESSRLRKPAVATLMGSVGLPQAFRTSCMRCTKLVSYAAVLLRSQPSFHPVDVGWWFQWMLGGGFNGWRVVVSADIGCGFSGCWVVVSTGGGQRMLGGGFDGWWPADVGWWFRRVVARGATHSTYKRTHAPTRGSDTHKRPKTPSGGVTPTSALRRPPVE
jgi:hypothetical protein